MDDEDQLRAKFANKKPLFQRTGSKREGVDAETTMDQSDSDFG